VRARDDPGQSAAASELIEQFTESDPGYLSLVTIVEVYWVLCRAYTVGVGRCTELVEGLLDARELRVGDEAVMRAALTADGVDLADAIISELGRVAGWDHTANFDQRAAQAGAMRLLLPLHQGDS
jgi:predicted nucleic-acid-binding protein